jgi:hypothetical protein
MVKILQLWITDYYTQLYYKIKQQSFILMRFRGSLSKHPDTLVQYLDWVPVTPA